MTAAWLLTLFALTGIAFGVFLGRSRTLSPQLAATGGGLLAGISTCWIAPEVIELSGWRIGIALPFLSFALLFGIDALLHKLGHSRLHSFALPLLTAAVIHSTLDGWSVRILSLDPFASVAVPLGLALHKVPEGLALGLVSRKSFSSAWVAFAAGAAAELFTVVGAFVEPAADAVGAAHFGKIWTSAVLAIVTGGFLFLGAHTVLPARKQHDVVLFFMGAFALAAAGAFAHTHFHLG